MALLLHQAAVLPHTQGSNHGPDVVLHLVGGQVPKLPWERLERRPRAPRETEERIGVVQEIRGRVVPGTVRPGENIKSRAIRGVVLWERMGILG